tara:strand:+ start:122 stop:463 length:342 start_codon:yes stop_codon:yes gene_type:complete
MKTIYLEDVLIVCILAMFTMDMVKEFRVKNKESQVMGDYITSRDLDRGNALTGVARQQAEASEAKEAKERGIKKVQRLQAEIEELKLERAIAADMEKQIKAKAKRKSNAKKGK